MPADHFETVSDAVSLPLVSFTLTKREDGSDRGYTECAQTLNPKLANTDAALSHIQPSHTSFVNLLEATPCVLS